MRRAEVTASTTPVRSSAGGAANEFGSLHRGGIATVLGVHGLAGAPIHGRPGCVPVRLALETDEQVDDIRCEMENGTTWFIQAKRSASMTGLRATASQWVHQDAYDDDRLVLATRNAGGTVARLRQLLPRWQRDQLLPLSARDQAALQQLRSVLKGAGADEVEQLLQRVEILDWPAEEASDPAAQVAIARLEGLLVRPAEGAAAFRALRDFFHTAAAWRTASGPADWLRALTDARLDVRASPSGSTAERLRYQARIEADYRSAHAAALNRLDLSALTALVPELAVDGLAESMTVQCAGEDPASEIHALLDVLRRNPRFVLRGLPGMGKSAAMRQMAAWLAADPEAPLPIPVNLRALATNVAQPSDITLSTLLHAAAFRAASAAPSDVEPFLHAAVGTGHAVLLLDGFDETFQKSATVAVGLRGMLDAIHPACGLVVATRDSAIDAVSNLGLPAVELAPPRGQDTLFALLDALAARRGLADDVLEQWRTTRRHEVEEHARSRGAIWSVPLLATLATLQLSDSGTTAEDPFRLLNEVIDRSIRTWTSRYDEQERQNLDPGLRPEMLMVGFAAIGRLLTSDEPITPQEAARAVEAVLQPWALPTVRAASIAAAIVEFWDERVGIFVETGNVLEPRSQQFAELGDARAVLTLDSPEQQVHWVKSALSRNDRQNAVSLATSASIDLARHLLREARSNNAPEHRARASHWIMHLSPHWRHLQAADAVDLCEVLCHAARHGLVATDRGPGGSLAERLERLEERGGPGWLYAVALAALPFPAAFRDVQRNAVLSLDAFKGRQWLTLALLSLGAATADHRLLTIEELQQLDVALEHVPPDEPDEHPRTSVTGAYSVHLRGPRALPGMGQLAALAVEHARQLSNLQAQVLYRLAWQTPMSEYLRISRALQAAGFTDENDHRMRFPTMSRELLTEFEDLAGFGWIRRRVAAMALSPASISPTELWRMTQLADLVEALGWNSMTVLDLQQIQALPQRAAAAVVEAGVHRAEVNLAQLAEIVYVVSSRDDADARGQMLYAPRLVRLDPNDAPLRSAVAVELIPTLLSPSDWLASLGCRLLVQQGPDPLVHAACRDIVDVPTSGTAQRNLGVALLMTSSRQIEDARDLALHAVGYRCAVGLVLRAEPSLAGEALLATLRQDPDATVRYDAGADAAIVLAAPAWACLHCGVSNASDLSSCTACSRSCDFRDSFTNPA